jgi:predicted metal-dependent phosphoesterase TrpH
MLKVELHTHTADDPVDLIPHTAHQLIDRAAALGYQALAITLHDRQMDVRPLTAYAAERGIVLIPGTERTLNGAHVLLLNFTPAAESVESFEDVAALKAREPVGLVVAPHPYFPGTSCLWGALNRYASLFDAVEWNAMYTPAINFNRPAARWAARHGRPMVGNGDVHRLHQLGTCYSLVDAPAEPHAICAAIKKGHVIVKSQPLSLSQAALTMADLTAAQLRHLLTPLRSIEARGA